MPEKFLYYLGAGASAQALPTVKPIEANSKIINEGFVETLRNYAKTFADMKYASQEQMLFLQEMAGNMLWLADASSAFATLDTYAKYLFLTDNEKLQKLKMTLSVFFSLYQTWGNKVDKRYLSWITSVMSIKMFPENIKILTWNYDFQIQLAARIFQGEKFEKFNSISKHSPPLIEYWPAVGWSGIPGNIPDNISLIHLNGLAGTYFDSKSKIYKHVLLDEDDLNPNGNLYNLRENIKDHIFDFAWESGIYQDWLIRLSQKTIAATTIMVVIGYSFPFFNRDIDKKMFEVLKESGTLRKIYFQDPTLDGSFLRAQFNLDDSIDIIHRKETDSFYIPFEM